MEPGGDALDNETSLDHTDFRQYASTLGRWNSPDPLAGNLSNPQSLNRYTYVVNQPCRFTDPLGLCAFNIAIDNKAGVPAPRLAAALAELNKILGANNSGLGTQFNGSENNNFTVNLVNVNSGFLGLSNSVPANTYGENDAWFGGWFGLANSTNVYANNIQAATAQNNSGTALGRVITHEFGHFGLQVVDNNIAGVNPALGIMSPGAPYLNNSNFDFFAKNSIPTLQALCEHNHPSGSGAARWGTA